MLASASAAAWAQQASPIPVSKQQQERLGIVLADVKTADSVVVADMVGRVTRAPSSVRSIVAPFAGVVVKVHALPGTTVKAGDPLISISSRDYASVSSTLTQARSEMRVAEAALARQTQLLTNGLVARSTVEEARARAESARARVAEASALSSGMNAGGDASAYVVRATAAGRISMLGAHVGDNVNAMTTLASLTTAKDLWVEFQVPARLMGKFAPGDGVELSSGGRGQILSVTDVLDPTTWSASAYAALPPESDLYEGQLVRGHLSRTTTDAKLISAPARSVVQIDGQDHVFRRTPDGFSPTPVQVVGRTEEAATLRGGLRPGDAVAISGLTELKALAMQGG